MQKKNLSRYLFYQWNNIAHQGQNILEDGKHVNLKKS